MSYNLSIKEQETKAEKEAQFLLIKRLNHLFITAYLLLLFCVYPFYMPEGYVDIGEAKYRFFLYISLAALIILILFAVLEGIKKIRCRMKAGEAYLIPWSGIRISITDLLAGLLVLEISLSYYLSDFRQEAFWGTEGWRIGLILFLILCGLYFIISRQWRPSMYIWYAAMAASGAVFLLGILDRFSIYLIPLSIRDPAFISTLGNINWFCGYLTVLTPVGSCIFLSAKTLTDKWISGCYLFVAFAAGFCQGSSSVFLFFGALFLILLWTGISKKEWVIQWLFLIAVWGAAGGAVRLLKMSFPEGYNYEADSLCLVAASSNWLLLAAFICLLTGLILKKKAIRFPENNKSFQRIRILLAVIPIAGVLLWAVLSFWNTRWGIPGLIENPLFLFHESWGNGRGATWSAGIRLFGGMDGAEKLFGTGPDCFSAYAYSQPQTAGMLRDYFGDSRLTNAHNELLTSLVNIGIVGTVFYFGLFLSGMIRCLKKAEKKACLLIPAVSIFCYLIHNMVSFAQVLNLPYVFVIMAMGEGMLRRDTEDTEGS